MARNSSESKNIKFRNSLIEHKNYKSIISELIDLCYGTSIIEKNVKNYLIDKDLEKEWKIVFKLLVKASQLDEISIKKISEEVFDISSDEKFEIFKNHIEKLKKEVVVVEEEEYKTTEKNEKVNKKINDKLLKIKEEILENISEEFEGELKDYFQETEERNDEDQIKLINKIKKFKSKKTKNNIPTTKAYQMLGINNEYYKKNLKNKMEDQYGKAN